jgi:hypothetical protein
MLKQYGVDIRVYEKTQNDDSKVYGKEAAQDENLVDTIQGIITSADLVPSDGASSGTFDEGWLFTDSSRSLVGSRIEIVRDDDLKRQYQVESEISSGMTVRVFKKYRLSPVGEQETS